MQISEAVYLAFDTILDDRVSAVDIFFHIKMLASSSQNINIVINKVCTTK